ncbi:mCG145079, partial [Mus musculus]
ELPITRSGGCKTHLSPTLQTLSSRMSLEIWQSSLHSGSAVLKTASKPTAGKYRSSGIEHLGIL